MGSVAWLQVERDNELMLRQRTVTAADLAGLQNSSVVPQLYKKSTD